MKYAFTYLDCQKCKERIHCDDCEKRLMEEAQNALVNLFLAQISSREVDAGKWCRIPVYFVAPQEGKPQGVIFYLHGTGWVFGSFHTHEKLVRELCARTHSLIVFPEYTRSPEAKFPVAIEQCYSVLSHLREIPDSLCPFPTRSVLAITGDSVGGNMAIAMVIMAMQRDGPQSWKASVLSCDQCLLRYAVLPSVRR